MTTDDILAYLSSTTKRQRPTELRSDSRMLFCWLRLRNDREFIQDVIQRHGLQDEPTINRAAKMHEHAISNAWGHCVDVLLESFPPREDT